jgi:plastocyanin
MISHKNRIVSERSAALGLLIAAITGVGLSSSIMSNNNSVQVDAQQEQANNDSTRVKAGAGNATDVEIAFIPQKIEIKAGQTVNWYNPTEVSEPHTVTFIKDPGLFPAFAAPFSVPNSTEFKALMPNQNFEPLIVPNPPGADPTTKTVIMDNARAYTPTVIDSTGKNVTYLPMNANYTMDGTETYINSGWMWPEGKNPPDAPPIAKFGITFEKPGTYAYVCAIHPWMTGSVVVS